MGPKHNRNTRKSTLCHNPEYIYTHFLNHPRYRLPSLWIIYSIICDTFYLNPLDCKQNKKISKPSHHPMSWPRLHRHAIFGKVPVRLAGLRWLSGVFFFFFLFASPTRRQHSSDMACRFLNRPYWSYFGYTRENSGFWLVNLNRLVKKKKRKSKSLVVACHHRSGHRHNADLRVLCFFFSASRCCYCCSAASFSSYFSFIFFSSFFSFLFIFLSLVLSTPTPWELNSFLLIDTFFKELTPVWTVKV